MRAESSAVDFAEISAPEIRPPSFPRLEDPSEELLTDSKYSDSPFSQVHMETEKSYGYRDKFMCKITKPH